MKKFFVILFVFLLLIGVSVWEQITVNKYLDDIQNKTLAIINITTNVENIQTQEIIKKVDELEKTWKDYESVLCLIANHKDMRDLCVEIQRLRGNIEVNQFEDFTASLKIIYHLAQDYHYLMGVSWQNVF